MRKFYLAFAVLGFLAHGAAAQGVITITNDATTGTKVGHLAKRLTSGSNSTAIVTATTDYFRIAGIVVGWSTTDGTNPTATTGSAIIAQSGVATCVVDAGGVTAGNPVTNSTATAGDCMDATGHPTMEVVGYALATVASGPVSVTVITGRPAAFTLAPPLVVTATGNIDLSATSATTACGTGIEYTGGSPATLTILATAAPGCQVPLVTNGQIVTIAVSGGTFVTACSSHQTRASGSGITLWVLSNVSSNPVVALGGDCV